MERDSEISDADVLSSRREKLMKSTINVQGNRCAVCSRTWLQAWNDMKVRATVQSNERIEKSFQVLKYKQIVRLLEDSRENIKPARDVIRLQLKCQQLEENNAFLRHHLQGMRQVLESLDLSSSSDVTEVE
jgi:hypothetical protein